MAKKLTQKEFINAVKDTISCGYMIRDGRIQYGSILLKLTLATIQQAEEYKKLAKDNPDDDMVQAYEAMAKNHYNDWMILHDTLDRLKEDEDNFNEMEYHGSAIRQNEDGTYYAYVVGRYISAYDDLEYLKWLIRDALADMWFNDWEDND